MAIPVPTYTGENAGGLLPKFSGEKLAESQEKMFQTVLETGKFKYTEKKKEEAEFLKNVYVKPEFMISAKARTEMANAFKAHNDKWSQILKNDVKAEGKFSFDHQIQLQNETSALKMAQDEYLQNMGRWKTINDWMVQDKGVNGDVDAWMQETKKLYDTGRIDMTTPPLKSISPYTYFQKNPVAGTKTPSKPIREVREGIPGYIDIELSGTVEQSKQHVEDSILSQPRLLDGAIKDFMGNATPEEKLQYLDVNKDQRVSETELRSPDKNGILEWAKDKYAPIAIGEKMYRWKETMQNEGGGGLSINIGGSKIKMPTGWLRDDDIKYGGTVYSNNYAFTNAPLISNMPVQKNVSQRLRGTYTTPILVDGSIKGQILEYNPEKDVLVVRATVGNDALGINSQDAIEIPAYQLSGVDDIPVVTAGRQTTIGELRKQSQPKKAQHDIGL